jgi:ribosome-associated translation inhibitor RaiA
MTEYEKLLQLYSKECQYAGAMKYILEGIRRELHAVESRKDVLVALTEAATRLERSLTLLKQEYEK